jgi:hypothetical protein
MKGVELTGNAALVLSLHLLQVLSRLLQLRQPAA